LTAKRPDTGADCLTSFCIEESASNARENLAADLSTASCNRSKGRALKNIANAITANNSRRSLNRSSSAYRTENGSENYGSGNLSYSTK
jgi:hypothetical protein